jgi:hypothetical protein
MRAAEESGLPSEIVPFFLLLTAIALLATTMGAGR